jgi:hypothetical protein
VVEKHHLCPGAGRGSGVEGEARQAGGGALGPLARVEGSVATEEARDGAPRPQAVVALP